MVDIKFSSLIVPKLDTLLMAQEMRLLMESIKFSDKTNTDFSK